jgi:hypothetical protein
MIDFEREQHFSLEARAHARVGGDLRTKRF